MELQENKIKVNVINGFLGVGKTTAIQYLLKSKPKQEFWAVVVNEVGEIGIDKALVDTGHGVEVAEIPGGCICCSLSTSLQITLSAILKKYRPHRIIIEPSGVGHPAGIIDLLEKGYAELLDLQAVITLINPKHLQSEKHTVHPTFIDQVELADVLVASKVDLCTLEEIQCFYEWAEKLFPAKQQILEVAQGDLPFALLNEPRKSVRTPKFPNAHQLEHFFGDEHKHAKTLENTTETYPVFYQDKRLGMFLSGVLFAVEDSFYYDHLLELLNSVKGVLRIKGVFNTNKGWYSYNRSGDEYAAFFPSGYRKDSRIELISDQQSVDLFRFVEIMKKLLVK